MEKYASCVADKSILLWEGQIRAVTLGMSAGIHITHKCLEEKYPDIVGTAIHYIENDKMINRWSFRILKKEYLKHSDFFFKDVECSDFGPPVEKVSVGDLRGGKDGISFEKCLKRFG
ncbi:hypothetical protein LCGC14_1975770 [marine sediment metagenome]|uniref:Uncharacterized protein n=1 Tax=marine sediment metagenome TaxID=412755 RepID=A0A0F9I7H7_9ZZZZ